MLDFLEYVARSNAQILKTDVYITALVDRGTHFYEEVRVVIQTSDFRRIDSNFEHKTSITASVGNKQINF